MATFALNDEHPTAYRGDEPFVFVSWSHADEALVMPEIAALNARGFRVNFDDAIHPGHVWHDELAAAIAKCSLFVFFITPRSIAAPICQRELNFALAQDKNVIAVHLEETTLPAGIAFAIGDRQAVLRYRLSESTYRQRFESAVATFVAPAAVDVTTDAPTVTPAQTAGQTIAQAEIRTLQAAARPEARRPMLRSSGIRTAAGAFAAVALVVGVWLLFRHWHDVSAAGAQRVAALAEAKALIQRDDYGAAFLRLLPLARAEGTARETDVGKLWLQAVNPMKPLVREAGATISFKPYNDVSGPWIPAGTTPLAQPVDAPRGVLRLRVVKAGYVTGEFAVRNPGPSVESGDHADAFFHSLMGVGAVPLELAHAGSVADGFVRVPATNQPVFVRGWTWNLQGDFRRHLPAFAVGRTEVTNKEFKAFVDAGGYDNSTYWAGLRFLDGERILSWPEARKRFVDQTGRPGPSGWQLGIYPSGQAGFPVGGVSWYEAVAFSRFRGLVLPTIHHWARAALSPYDAFFSVTPSVAAMSHFSSDAPKPALAGDGLGPWGTVNTAGNMREWVWNFAGNRGLALGGGWTDYSQVATDAIAIRPFDRSPQNGLRLMQYLDSAAVEADLLAPIDLVIDHAVAQKPVSDLVFESMRSQFAFVARPPSHVTITTVTKNEDWTASEVKLTFASGEPFTLFVVEPVKRPARMQAVIYAPPGDAIALPQPNSAMLAEQLPTVDFVVRSGRALVMPIWAASYERFTPPPIEKQAFFDLMHQTVLAWHRDLATTLNYLQTRSDIDSGHVATLGYSSGAAFMIEPLLAIEGRVKTAVLLSGGLFLSVSPGPMDDAINYAPRTRMPVLMINGRYDNLLPYALALRPYFDQLATPAKDKRLVLFDSTHTDWPRNLVAKEVTDWLDHYLGPVKTH